MNYSIIYYKSQAHFQNFFIYPCFQLFISSVHHFSISSFLRFFVCLFLHLLFPRSLFNSFLCLKNRSSQLSEFPSFQVAKIPRFQQFEIPRFQDLETSKLQLDKRPIFPKFKNLKSPNSFSEIIFLEEILEFSWMFKVTLYIQIHNKGLLRVPPATAKWLPQPQDPNSWIILNTIHQLIDYEW